MTFLCQVRLLDNKITLSAVCGKKTINMCLNEIFKFQLLVVALATSLSLPFQLAEVTIQLLKQLVLTNHAGSQSENDPRYWRDS